MSWTASYFALHYWIMGSDKLSPYKILGCGGGGGVGGHMLRLLLWLHCSSYLNIAYIPDKPGQSHNTQEFERTLNEVKT